MSRLCWHISYICLRFKHNSISKLCCH